MENEILTPNAQEPNILKVLKNSIDNFKTHFNREPVSITVNPFSYHILNSQVFIKADNAFEKPEDVEMPEMIIQIGNLKLEIIINNQDQSQKQTFEIR